MSIGKKRDQCYGQNCFCSMEDPFSFFDPNILSIRRAADIPVTTPFNPLRDPSLLVDRFFRFVNVDINHFRTKPLFLK